MVNSPGIHRRKDVYSFLALLVQKRRGRKAASLLSAVALWLLLYHGTIVQKVCKDVRVHVVHIPAGKMLVNPHVRGSLKETISLQLRGKRSALDSIDLNKIEVRIDAREFVPVHYVSTVWPVKITLQQVIGIAPIPRGHILEVSHEPLLLQFAQETTAQIPVYLHVHNSLSNKYCYLSVSPQTLSHTVTGPQQEIEALKQSGLHLNIPLDSTLIPELDLLFRRGTCEEMAYPLPEAWKTVSLPFGKNSQITEEITLYFIHHRKIPLPRKVPVRCIPQPNKKMTYADSPILAFQHGQPCLDLALFLDKGTEAFAAAIMPYLECVVLLPDMDSKAEWYVRVSNPELAQRQYIDTKLQEQSTNQPEQREYHAARFSDYFKNLLLVREDRSPLNLLCRLQDQQIHIHLSSPLDVVQKQG